MTVVRETPGVDGLGAAVAALREWQTDGSPAQLHPGDLGWFWRFGAAATAAAVRTWSRDGRILAVGLLAGPALLRLTTAPDARRDEELARALATDVTDPGRGVLPAGRVDVDAPVGTLLPELLAAAGWGTAEPWTPLRRDLARPVPDPGLRIEVAGPDQVGVRTALQRASFDNSTFTDDRWHAMAAGLPYADAQCLIAYDDRGDPVGAATVWSAGPGRPGLIEPLGVHRDSRGRGHGTAITLATAVALRRLGASAAVVATLTRNAAGVAAYESAGFTRLPEIRARHRP